MGNHQYTDIRIPIEPDNPSVMRIEEKCIKCGQCKRVCTEDIAVGGYYDLKSTGDIAICIHCGQCANVCPPSSITEVYEYQKVREAVADPDKIVIFSTSPSVRIALGEEFGMEKGSYAEGKMVGALRALGADYVLDTTFSADLTITEEASELIERIKGTSGKPLPQFTSCCPAWVKLVETFYPELIDNVSTSKSPIGMQGPTIKTYFADKMGLDSSRIVNVAVTPCTAKKFEIRRQEMNAASRKLGIEGMMDMDYVITTRELAKWLKEDGLNLADVEQSDFDSLLGRGSGAGIIFGNTGGVMEAAVRTAYFYITGERPPEGFFELKPVRGLDGIKSAEVEIGGLKVKAAAVHGTANARKLIDLMKRGEADYHFIEVMTCRGGCIGGGGQPLDTEYLGDSLRQSRIDGLYKKDELIELRLSHENPDIVAVYKEFYGKPLSPLAEEMLHTAYTDRSADLGENRGVTPVENKDIGGEADNKPAKRFVCTVCGYVHEGDEPPEECPLCHMKADKFKPAE